MATFSAFSAGVPSMRIEDGLFVIEERPHPGELRMSLYTARAVAHHILAVLDEYQSRPDPVIPLCEFCDRRSH